LSNSKRGIAVDENGKLDDEVSVISSEVHQSQLLSQNDNQLTQNFYSKLENFTKTGSSERRDLPARDGMPSKRAPYHLDLGKSKT
jgi:hypothetical protein